MGSDMFAPIQRGCTTAPSCHFSLGFMKTPQREVHRSVAKLFDARLANRLADILADELIPAEVVDAPPLGFEVWVKDEHFARAQALWNATTLTEEELTYLATGVLGEVPGSS